MSPVPGHKVLPGRFRSVVAPGPPAASVTAVLERQVTRLRTF